MVNREAYKAGLRCKGFNCPNCKDKQDCYQYIMSPTTPEPQEIKVDINHVRYEAPHWYVLATVHLPNDEFIQGGFYLKHNKPNEESFKEQIRLLFTGVQADNPLAGAKILHARHFVSDLDGLMCNDKAWLKDHTMDKLIGSLADYIRKHLDDLPIELTEVGNDSVGATEHRIRMCIVDERQLRRLLKIENEYNKIKEDK